jgi:hypothetical protein
MTASQDTRDADGAIRNAREGRIAIDAMLESLLPARVFVLLAGPPVMEGDALKRWKPATVTKQDDDTQLVVVFTDEQVMAAFARANPLYSHVLLVECRWVIDNLPADHGLVFNVGGENGFEWPATGITQFFAEREPAPR